MKQVITWSLILIVLFVVFIGLAFVALNYMTPTAEDIEKIKKQAPVINKQVEVSDSTAVVEPKITVADSLQQIIENLTSDLFFVRVTTDSLNEVLGKQELIIAGYTSQIESLEERNQALQSKSVSIKELAKTYETMKVSDIRPILEKVDDATIVALYKNMGSRTRKNIIQALSSVRAAQLTNKLVRN